MQLAKKEDRCTISTMASDLEESTMIVFLIAGNLISSEPSDCGVRRQEHHPWITSFIY